MGRPARRKNQGYDDKEIWEHHLDLFAEEDAELLQIGTKVLGRQMKQIAMKNDLLYQRINTLLEKNIVAGESSKMAGIMTGYFQNSVMDNVRLLEEIKQEFSED
ncbi:MAG: hypothetical protein ACTHK8_20480 [Ginsengibacter sp.]